MVSHSTLVRCHLSRRTPKPSVLQPGRKRAAKPRMTADITREDVHSHALARDVRDIAREVGAGIERLQELERLLDRTLYTACAAYAYARACARGAHTSDEAIAQEVRGAYQRQRALASQEPS